MTLRVFGLFLTTLFLTPSFAIEYQSARTLALGGAGRAAPFLTDSIYLNPSYASFTPVYSMQGGYTWSDAGRNYNLSVQDSRTELFQAGLGFTKRDQNNVLSFGASKSFLQTLSAGVGSKTLFDDGSGKMTSDFLVSGAFVALPWLYTGLIVENLLQSNDGLARNLYRTLYLGFKFIPDQMVHVYFDPLYSPSYGAGKKFGYSVGVEIAALQDFYFRAGKFQDAEAPHLNTRGDGFGLGAAWVGPKINLEYAMSRLIRSHGARGFTNSQNVSMTIFF